MNAGMIAGMIAGSNVLWPVVSVIGLLVGSFLNVVAIRVPQKMSLVKPSSRCMSCGEPIRWRDMVPVISYVWNRGRCRQCGSRISAVYPAGELLACLSLTLVFRKEGWTPEWMVGSLFAATLVTLTISDLLYMLIPDRILLPAMAALAALRLYIHPLPLWNYFVASAGAFILLYLIAAVFSVWVRGDAMGFGDIKLFAFLGLGLGMQNTGVAFFLSVLLGSLGGLFLRLTGRIGRGQPFPFGPFVAVSAIVSYLWGSDIVKMYTQGWL
jgi:leader peptidase (prepilin peptidase)/N-methyltransferase